MSHYNLTSKDLAFVQAKIKKQSDFLDQEFTTQSGQVKTLRDVSFSANHSERYYSQLLNKIHTLDSYNLDLDNEPIFLTITLDGFFRDLIKGNYKRFGFEETCRYVEHIPNDNRNGYILDKMFNKEPLTVRDCYQILSYQTRRFFRSYVFQNMKKKGLQYSYIRVTEPHKDGVPHFHILLYAPKDKFSSIYQFFKHYFPAPQNHKPLSIKRNGRNSFILPTGEPETQGFQFEIKKATGYILKYILKSFRNVVNDEDIDYLQAWYIYHKIPRIVSSHTLIPAWVYQKLALLEDDWHYHNHTHKNNIAIWQNEKYDDFGVLSQKAYFVFNDEKGRIFTYKNGIFKLQHNGFLIHSFGTDKLSRTQRLLLSFKYYVDKPSSFNPLQRNRFIGKISLHKKSSYEYVKVPLIPVIFEDSQRTLFMSKRELIPKDAVYFKSVKNMTLLDLWLLYDNFDFDLNNPKFFGNIKNELIRRGLLDLPFENLNNFNTDFDTGAML